MTATKTGAASRRFAIQVVSGAVLWEAPSGEAKGKGGPAALEALGEALGPGLTAGLTKWAAP